MSAGKTLTRLTEQLYAAHWILAALQKRPRSFAGVTLYANEAHTLRIIAQNEGISQTEISALMLRTKGATSAMVDKLVEKKLVYRQRERGDQRRYLLMLAPLGRQVYEELVRRAETYASEVVDALPLTVEELETAHRVLSILVEHYADRGRQARLEE